MTSCRVPGHCSGLDQSEIMPTVLQGYSGIQHNKARSKTHVVALNEGDHISIAISGA
jgi:hypothetical protein